MTLWHKVGHKVIVKVKVKVMEGYFSNKAGTLPNNYFVESCQHILLKKMINKYITKYSSNCKVHMY